MLKRLHSVENYRIFKDWAALPGPVEFKSMNLVYGVNGSGKSTLVSLLRDAKKDVEWESGLNVTVLNATAQEVNVRHAAHEIWQSILTFDRDYVRENLQFDEVGGGTAQPLLILGADEIGRAQRLADATVRKIEIHKQLPIIERRKTTESRARDQLATDTGNVISQELGLIGGRYDRRAYDAKKVKDLIGKTTEAVAESALTEQLTIARQAAITALPTPMNTVMKLDDIHEQVVSVLAKTATGVAIDMLRDDHVKANWVQAGLPLHNADDSCAFCDGPVTQDRLDKLALHFDQSMLTIQTEIRTQLQAIAERRTELAAALSGLPAQSDLAGSLSHRYSIAHSLLDTATSRFTKYAEALADSLNQKASNLFTSQTLDAGIGSPPTASTSEINSVIQQHNDLVKTFEEVRLKAAGKVEHTRIHAIEAKYKEHSDAIAEEETAKNTLTTELIALNEKVTELSQQGLDARPLAESLNADLSRLLGRDELTFALDTKEGYRLHRSGKPASYLSEGEKNAIALLHFLKSLDTHAVKPEKTIVIIDDPLSSLDSNVVAGVSAHLWARLIRQHAFRQVFVLTHNFDFFRAWSNNCDRLPESVRTKIGFAIMEIRTQFVDDGHGNLVRTPLFLDWPSKKKDRDRLRSEYHYLFWRVAHTLEDCNNKPSPEKDMDAATILPNICRRMLEAFLSFRFPESIGDFRTQLTSAIELLHGAVTQTLMLNFLNAYSHNEEGNIGKSIPRPESMTVLSGVFELIRELDPDHYNRMCASLDVHPLMVVVSSPAGSGLLDAAPEATGA
jgi:wobble nucleotide-excising tRNase